MEAGTTNHLVIGLGEVGSAIQRIFGADGIDDRVFNSLAVRPYKYLHVCIPYSEKFIDIVNEYRAVYKPGYVIIHSTVPVGTSRKLNALHSPIRGLHPDLYKGIMTFEKFIGGSEASWVANEFRRAGLKVILCDTQEATELGKLLDTEYYRACIEFTLKAKELCDKHKVPFHESYTLFNETYNVGYTKLEHPEYVRPVLQPIMQPIGGHCVIPNSKLI
jgi:hypothetical protein